MTKELELNILIADRCTKKEAERYLKNGTCIIPNIESEKNAFVFSLIGVGYEKDEALAEWDKLTEVEYSGKSYKVEYVH